MQYQLKEQPEIEFKKENIISTNNSIKKSKLKHFLSVFSYISKSLFKDNNSTQTLVEINPFELQASTFLDSENYEAYINMLKSGYVPTKQQEQIMDKIVHNAYFYKSKDSDDFGITYSEELLDLEKILSLGYQLKQTDVLKFIQHSSTTIFSRHKDFFKNNTNLYTICMFKQDPLPTLSQQIRTLTAQPDFSDKLLQIFKNNIPKNSRPKKETIENFNFILELNPDLLLRNVSLQEFLELNKNFTPMYDSKEQNILINGIVNKYYAKDMQPFYTNVKQRYTTDFVENLIVNKVKREIEVLKEIPNEALDIIQFIELTFKNIQKQSHTSIENLDNLQLMVEKRIPEVVSKYLTIDIDYRTSLKNMEGKNAQELMLDSLQNISSIFQEVYKELNQETLHSLSATNKYTKSIK